MIERRPGAPHFSRLREVGTSVWSVEIRVNPWERKFLKGRGRARARLRLALLGWTGEGARSHMSIVVPHIPS